MIDFGYRLVPGVSVIIVVAWNRRACHRESLPDDAIWSSIVVSYHILPTMIPAEVQAKEERYERQMDKEKRGDGGEHAMLSL